MSIQSEFEQTIKRVSSMVADKSVVRLAETYGLTITNISWEDTARTKNSIWGPCISDMTLQVGEHRMPVIRNTNFEDLSWDIPIEKIPLVVGNEIGGSLYTVSLKEYLSNFRSYLFDPSGWKGERNSLLADRDSHVITTSQACFLPVIQGTETEFNVAVFNYQTKPERPTVLVIVATSKGTSAQILDQENKPRGQKLYFNQKGKRCSFTAQRLSDRRALTGLSSTAPMSQQEKQDNMVVIIQVPLKKAASQKLFLNNEQKPVNKMFSPSNVEDAFVSTTGPQGQFVEMGNHENIERDTNYPIRVTLQYYKTTDNGILDEATLKGIVSQLENSRKNADAISSLVVGGNTHRTTEHTQPKALIIPPWWSNFWLAYSGEFPHYSKEQAEKKLFQDGRFQNTTMREAQDRALAILKSNQKEEVLWSL